MPRMQILTTQEREAFDSPPRFKSVERKQFFELTPRVDSLVAKMRTPINAIGFLVTLGYFKATKRFFGLNMLNHDVQYVAAKLGYLPEVIDKHDYDKTTASRHRSMILQYQGYKEFNESAQRDLASELRVMASSQSQPKFMFLQALDILGHRKTEVPNSWTLNELILEETKRHKSSLTATIDEHISTETRRFLDSLLEPQDGTNSRLQKSRLALLKRISQSTKPSKIKGTVDDFTTLCELYHDVKSVIDQLDLTPDGIRYYAEAVLKSKVFQVSQRVDDDRCLHLVCFVAHQCYRLQDTLVDIMLTAVQSTTGACEREHKDIYYESRNEQRQGVRRLITHVDEGVVAPLSEIASIVYDEQLGDCDKVQRIQDVLLAAKGKRETATENLEGLREQLEPHAAEAEYFQALESKSLKLQNRVSGIVKAVELHGANVALAEAIQHYKEKDGSIAQTAPVGFLSTDERKALLDDDGKFRVSLYKALLFLKIADAIKSGALNLKLSYKYRSLDDYLIPKETWDANRDDFLERAELAKATDCSMTLDSLAATLHGQYQQTNRNIENGENTLVRFFKDGRFHVATPKLEETESEPLGSLFPNGRYISLLEILATVSSRTRFLDSFEHWKTKHVRAKPHDRVFFAGIMGLGCFIGTRKMEKISKAIDGSELETTVNAYFSPENIQAANDSILKLMDELQLPDVYRGENSTLHTASDGQKYGVAVESLNANYSFKYFGKDRGATAYRFLDSRNFEWYGDVFSSADKEAHYVIDGLMHNDVVKSDIHSTDTDGYSEVVFGVTHLLGFSFAPRLKNLKAKTIYAFREHTRKAYQDEGFRILPNKYVNAGRIRSQWDDVLRFVATIKLRHATASQLFKRLNSYSNQHPLYKALKEYGRIHKSDFILRYIDILDFRQAIEKQLNIVENSNKFSKAVSLGNSHGFLDGEKVEQVIAEGCKRLIKNAIICWNYLYLTQVISSEDNSERREEMIEMVRRGSVATWKHVNLQGEYDFTEDKMQDSFGLATPKNIELGIGRS